jgi:capsular exopolysaccharide synthesis family protein
LRAEVQRTKVELQSDSSDASWTRVKKLYEATPARPPDSKIRLAQTGAATVFMLGLPFVLFVWLDARKNHIHTAQQVAQGSRLSVIGSVPMIPRRVMRRLNGPSKRQQYWRTLLSESVDSIAAIVIRTAQSGANRVIMVSSATAGEGKTTLAGQLAVSLAGAGHQTLLVDFDLRRPTLHRVFGLSLEPGANEVLRREAELEAAIQPTLVPNLTVLSAGRSNQLGLAGLAPADLKVLFDRLRASFDFVVVDASPILPVVDTRLIGQHVDVVLLSVLRDVSRVPKLRAACQFLELFGIPVLGAVVAGSSEEAYSDTHYGPLSEAQVI